jgi:MAP/microtubule affinity-regulating kinase
MSSAAAPKPKKLEGNPDANLASIGNYVFQKTVGEGNFAKVKLAKHKLTGQEVAIKIIDKTSLDEKKLSKLYREVRIMKLLHHPNIVKLYEVIETKHTIFLVMEYVSGGELYDYLVVHGRMKEKEARAKFRQIISAVSYCHKKRVIHRDLKVISLVPMTCHDFRLKISCSITIWISRLLTLVSVTNTILTESWTLSVDPLHMPHLSFSKESVTPVQKSMFGVWVLFFTS